MILIYSNSGEWGGVDVLVARFAKYLLDRGINFRILERPTGRLRTEVPQGVLIDSSEIGSISSQITHVLLPSVSKLRDSRFPWSELSHAKLLAWVVHPNDVFRGFFPFSGLLVDWFGYAAVSPLRALFRAHAAAFDSYFKELIGSDGLIVMDGATARALRYFVPRINRDIATVPIPADASILIDKRTSSRTLRVGYMGRMDSMKWSAIEPFVRENLAPICSARPVEFILVTEGPHVSDLFSLCQTLGVTCKIHGYMPNEEAIRWIGSQVDVVVAMGTSALDMAGAGCPCIIVDPAAGKRARPQVKFRFVHETNDHTLGEFRDFPGYVAPTRSFIQCVEPAQLAEASSEGRKYVANKHNPEVCFERLLVLIHDSTASVGRVGDATQILLHSFARTRNSPVRSIFSGRSMF